MKIFLRVLTALTTAAVAVLAILNLPYAKATAPILIVLAALVQLEFYQLAARKYEVQTYPGVLAGLVYLIGLFYAGVDFLIPIVFTFALLALFSKSARPIEQLAVTLLGFFYVPWMLHYFIGLAYVKGGDPLWLLYVIAMVKFSDMGGFALGVAFGRHKMCPSVSPNKSWEGMFGSVLGGVLMSWFFMRWTGYRLPKAIALGVAAAVFGTLGDLVESRIKREVGAKDSATFMPAGLGGFLDMFDSLLFAPALFYDVI